MENQIKVCGSLDLSAGSGLIITRSSCVQLRVAHFRVMAYRTFSNVKHYTFLLKEAALQSLQMLDRFSSMPEMAKFGREFIFNYLYAKTVTEARSNESIERWIAGTENTCEHVCPFRYESDCIEAISGVARLNFHLHRKLGSWVGER